MPRFSTPVALFIFNRPLETARVFAAIREAKPSQLFVIADGPRNEKDVPFCEAARAVIKVDWPCEVKTNYSEKNLGCGKRPATGISWVFEHVERAILIEDDCVPNQSFFPFAQELLQKYESDERVMHIAGANFQEGNPRFDIRESYYASFIPSCFGCWATWRRAWKLYDYNMEAWPTLRDSGALMRAFHNRGGYERFARTWNEYHSGHITDSWDGQWAFACMSHNGLSLVPKVNLIRNIGFNERATHTKKENERAEMSICEITFPLVHPSILSVNRDADDYMFRFYFSVDRQLHYRLLRPFKNHLPNTYQTLKKLFRR